MRSLVPREIRSHDLEGAVRAIDGELGSDPAADDASPVFVLSAGWRSGSTLVQRLLCSRSELVVWGEPFGEAIPVPRMASMLEAFVGKAARRSAESYDGVAASSEAPLSEQWIANLNPGFPALRRAQRAFLDALLAEPAQQKGHGRWGAKWVRLSAHHALHLRWLYPRARFVFLVRDPVAAYRSYRGKCWYTIDPIAPVDNVFKFAAHWKYLADSFLELHERLDALLLRYEDLIRDPEVLTRLSRHCQVDIDPSVLSLEVAGTSRKKKPLAAWQRAAVELVTAGTRRRLERFER